MLAVEIARSSVSADRAMAAVYAKGEVPELWIVDTERRRLEVRRAPSAGEYGFLQTFGEADRVPGPERDYDVAVSKLLP